MKTGQRIERIVRCTVAGGWQLQGQTVEAE